jgi:uncharacterized protein YgiM (DUF1202 family)
MQPSHRRVRINVAHEVQYREPISVQAGEKVMVGREDDEFPGWKWCKASNGREGWIPVELLSYQGAEAIVRQDYSSRELAVESGEEVTIEDMRHDWLLVRNAKGDRGWIPALHTEPSKTP